MTESFLTGGDLVLHQQGGGLVAGGFKIDSLIGNSVALKGLKDLSVPAGLFLLQRPCRRDYDEFIKHDGAIDNTLFDALVSSVEYVQPTRVSKKKTTKKKKDKNIKGTRKSHN